MPATRTSLVQDLRALTIAPGDVVMVHASVRSVGPVVGGVNTIIQALLEALGPEGTIVAYVDFEPFFEEGDPEVPVFDKRIAHAARDHGVLHEALRTWPGALRSDHPDAGVVAIGRLAEWITAEHPFLYGYGEGSPFERTLQANATVLMLGAPLDTISLLHYAEHRATIPGKRVIRYRRLMPGKNGAPEWVDFEEFDTSEPVNAQLPADCFEQIGRAYLASSMGRVGMFGEATATLLDAKELVEFAIWWLEKFFEHDKTTAAD